MPQSPLHPAVAAANALTRRWCDGLGDGDAVVSAAGVWPLLALLAAAADEPAKAELAAALGRPADTACADAQVLLDLLRSEPSAGAALGVWATPGLPLRPDWTAQVPDGLVGVLSDRAVLDRWASDSTAGLIEEFPLEIGADAQLVLACALAARIRWRDRFDSWPYQTGTEDGDPARRQLHRRTFDPAEVAILDETVLRVVVAGDGDLDVHLLLGDRPCADVLAAGLAELAGTAAVRPAADCADGFRLPGLKVGRTQWFGIDAVVNLTLPSFEITARHDLLAHPELFGLDLVSDADGAHLPGLSPLPMFVGRGCQQVLARFFDEGFEAAAVSVVEVPVTGACRPQELYPVPTLDVDFDRPFGFLAVHRPSGLALTAGWVAGPFATATDRETR